VGFVTVLVYALHAAFEDRNCPRRASIVRGWCSKSDPLHRVECGGQGAESNHRRADFQNPSGLLRHGQTGNVLINRTLKNALVIPQRATFEILDKRYVYVVDEDHVVHQRAIVIQNELDDIFVIKSGLDVNDKIVLEGVRQVHDGEKSEYEFREPEVALANQKNHAE
jgi:membrane fusion protein (multidrug efflux system)